MKIEKIKIQKIKIQKIKIEKEIKMILKTAKIVCYGIKNGEKVRDEKWFHGYTLNQMIEKARKYFKAFCILNDFSEYAMKKDKLEFGCYITDCEPFGNTPVSLTVYRV